MQTALASGSRIWLMPTLEWAVFVAVVAWVVWVSVYQRRHPAAWRWGCVMSPNRQAAAERGLDGG